MVAECGSDFFIRHCPGFAARWPATPAPLLARRANKKVLMGFYRRDLSTPSWPPSRFRRIVMEPFLHRFSRDLNSAPFGRMFTFRSSSGKTLNRHCPRRHRLVSRTAFLPLVLVRRRKCQTAGMFAGSSIPRPRRNWARVRRWIGSGRIPRTQWGRFLNAEERLPGREYILPKTRHCRFRFGSQLGKGSEATSVKSRVGFAGRAFADWSFFTRAGGKAAPASRFEKTLGRFHISHRDKATGHPPLLCRTPKRFRRYQSGQVRQALFG